MRGGSLRHSSICVWSEGQNNCLCLLFCYCFYLHVWQGSVMLKLLIFLLSTLSPSLLFFPSLTLCFSFHYRCTRWIQWDYLCLWSNLLWKNTHHGGTVQLNNSKGFLPRRTHMNTHTSFFFFYISSPARPDSTSLSITVIAHYLALPAFCGH